MTGRLHLRRVSWRAVRRIAWRAVAASAALAIAAAAAAWALVDWTDEGSDVYAGGGVLRNAAGDVMRVSLGEDDVDCRPFYRASPDDWIVRAVVASEDGTFWTHRGVRPLSALRAAFQNVTTGRRISGASTISMQTVRLVKPHPKNLFEKAKEAIRAVKMERRKDKLWILSQYLNRAPFGSNFVGVEAAAQGWFGKRAKDLGLGEAACLAGMVQAPSRFRPDRHLDAALKRRDYVLRRMRRLGYIDDDQLEAAQSVVPEVRRAPRPFAHPFFCDWVLAQRKGAVAGPEDLTTTLDEGVQRLCEEIVAETAAQGRYSSAAVVLRVSDAAVVALACSGDYFSPADADGQFNTAAAARPAGSTLKPFLTALAMDRGFVTPETRLLDVPRVYRGYRPTNFDSGYRGRVTVREALILSLNIPFLGMLEKVGVPEFGTALRALGLRQMGGGNSSFGLGMAIGNVNVTLVELVAAYAALARGGVYRPPTAFRPDGDGGASGGVRVFSPEAAYLVSDILSGDERSEIALGHVADVEVPRLAWKTGTSAAYRDAWTVAWNPEYVVGVWCGHTVGGFGDQTLVGAKASAPPCWKIARRLYPQNRGPWFDEPAGVVRRTVCSQTGLLAVAGCAPTETGRALRGVTPDLPCEGHAPDVRRRRLQIVKPANGDVIRLLPESGLRQVVCEVVNNEENARLWWFVDGRYARESVGRAAVALDAEAGEHVVTCATENATTASVRITVEKTE